MSKQDSIKEKLKDAKSKQQLDDNDLDKVSGAGVPAYFDGRPSKVEDPYKPGEEGWSDAIIPQTTGKGFTKGITNSRRPR